MHTQAARPGHRPRIQRRLSDEDSGRVTAFTVVIATTVLLFAGLVLDGGLALAAKVRAIGQTQEAARAGAQAIDLTAYRTDGTLRLDPDRAATLVRAYLSGSHAAGTANVTVGGDTVTVTISTAQPTRLLGLVGVGSIHLTATGSAHPDRGPVAGTQAGGP
jgi:hypothetical protein